MKTKLFLTALALPLVWGACSNDELISTDTPVQKGEMVEVGPNFVISATKGGNNSTTRAAWEKDGNYLNFLWQPIADADGTTAILDKIGLCWIGNAPSDVVYTNYEFVHAGWLAKDEKAAEVDPCGGFVKNGYNFHNLGFNTGALNNGDGAATDNDILAAVTPTDGVPYAKITATTENNIKSETDYNLMSAFFKTSAQTLFGGDYIAYSPFNKDFKDQGHIQATSPVEFEVNLTSDDTKFVHLGEAMFAYGYAPKLVGGTSASDFSFNNLSGLIRVRITGDMTSVEAVALVDANNNFITKVGLNAQKIIGGTTGTGLYVANEKETTNILTANVSNGIDGTNDVYFSALPTTTGALKVVLYNGTKSAVYDAAAISVKEGSLVNIEVTVASADFNKNVAITEDALTDMIGAGVSPITLLGDLRLTKDLSVNAAVTINGGRIIVPRADSQITMSITASATVNSDILTENRGCCANNAGKLEVGAASVKAVLGGVVDNYGEMEFATGTAVGTKSVTTVNGKINNHAEYITEQDETLYGSILIDNFATVELKEDIQNDGTMNIVGTGVTDNDGTLNVASGVKVTNANEMVNAGNINNRGIIANTAEGWFIDKIGSQFGLNQFDNTAKGQYVCEVNGQNRLNAAFSEAYPTTRVRFVNLKAVDKLRFNGKGHSYEFDMKNSKNTIDVEIAMDAAAIATKDTVILRTSMATAIAMKNLIVTSGNMQMVSDANIGGDLTVDGENAKDVDLLAKKVNVNGSVVLTQMAALNDAGVAVAPKMTIGGTANDNGVGATEMTVGDKFVVGDATRKSTKKAAVSFLNNNTTNITGAFDLNKPGLCTIAVASSSTVDNNAAFVWASAVNENGGTWGNSSKVKIKK